MKTSKLLLAAIVATAIGAPIAAFVGDNEPNGGIAYRFHARDLHLVMGGTPRTVDVDGDKKAP
jgi:hypothetical protein